MDLERRIFMARHGQAPRWIVGKSERLAGQSNPRFIQLRIAVTVVIKRERIDPGFGNRNAELRLALHRRHTDTGQLSARFQEFGRIVIVHIDGNRTFRLLHVEDGDLNRIGMAVTCAVFDRSNRIGRRRRGVLPCGLTYRQGQSDGDNRNFTSSTHLAPDGLYRPTVEKHHDDFMATRPVKPVTVSPLVPTYMITKG